MSQQLSRIEQLPSKQQVRGLSPFWDTTPPFIGDKLWLGKAERRLTDRTDYHIWLRSSDGQNIALSLRRSSVRNRSESPKLTMTKYRSQFLYSPLRDALISNSKLRQQVSTDSCFHGTGFQSCHLYAVVVQLVEHLPSKQVVASPNLVSRSIQTSVYKSTKRRILPMIVTNKSSTEDFPPAQQWVSPFPPKTAKLYEVVSKWTKEPTGKLGVLIRYPRQIKHFVGSNPILLHHINMESCPSGLRSQS